MEGKKPFSFRLISGFKIQSIFVKTLLLLLALIGVTVTSFYIVFRNLVVEQYREASQASNLLLMTKIDASMEAALSQSGAYMNDLLTSPSVTSMMVAPGRQDYDRLVEIMNSIGRQSASDELVSRSHIYIYGSDMVYSSFGDIHTISDFYDRDVILDYLSEGKPVSAFSFEEVPTDLMLRGERMFLFQAYPISKPMALLMVELEPDTLLNKATHEVVDSSDFMLRVYDRDRIPLFPGLMDYPQIGWGVDDQPVLEGEAQGESITYQYNAPGGLRYLVLTSREEIVPPYLVILASAFPYLLALLAVMIPLALLLMWTTYKPIQDVIYAMVSGPRSSDAQGTKVMGNEMEFIKDAYQDSEEQKQMLASVLADVAPAVLDNMFDQLLSGGESDAGNLSDLLKSVQSGFQMEGRYTVILLHFQLESGEAIPEVDCQINISWSLKFSRSYWDGRAQSHFMRSNETTLAGILQFAREDSGARIKFAVRTFWEAFAQQAAGQRYFWRMGTGKACLGLMEVRTSYLDAKADLGRNIYFHQDQAARSGGGAKGKEKQPDNNRYIAARMTQTIAQALEGRADKEGSAALIRDVTAQHGNHADLLPAYRTLHNVVVEEMVKLHMDVAPFSLDRVEGIAPDLPAMEAEMARVTWAALEAFSIAGQKGRNKYIESATKYIADHYMDSALSLNSISKHVGISSPYLSRIFSEHLSQGFLDYLNLYRIDKAKQLLAATDLTIAEIGFQVGFNSPQSFIRVFKKLVGSTPRQFGDSVKGTVRGEGG